MNTQEEMARLQQNPYRWAYDASERHRKEHGAGCYVYPTGSGPLLGVLAQATGAKRALEVGCGLGYSALCIAGGMAPDGRVDTIEAVPEHAELARANFAQAGVAGRIDVHAGNGLELMPGLSGPYGFVFLDSDWLEYPAYLPHLLRLVPPGGVIVSSNIFPHEIEPDMPGQEEAADYRRQIFSHPELVSAFLRGEGKALSLRV